MLPLLNLDPTAAAVVQHHRWGPRLRFSRRAAEGPLPCLLLSLFSLSFPPVRGVTGTGRTGDGRETRAAGGNTSSTDCLCLSLLGRGSSGNCPQLQGTKDWPRVAQAMQKAGAKLRALGFTSSSRRDRGKKRVSKEEEDRERLKPVSGRS